MPSSTTPRSSTAAVRSTRQSFTIDSQSVLSFITGLDVPPSSAGRTGTPTAGTHAYITNNNFYDNFDAAMQIEPNGLLAGDPLDAAGVGPSVLPRQRHAGQRHRWPGRGDRPRSTTSTPRQLRTTSAREERPTASSTIRLRQSDGQRRVGRDRPDLRPPGHGRPRPRGSSSPQTTRACRSPIPTAFTTEPSPTVTLTIQAALPGTLLADGTTVPSPGQSVIVKLLNDQPPNWTRAP